MKKFIGGILVLLALPQIVGATYASDNLLYKKHSRPSWFIAGQDGGFYGKLADGTTFTQSVVKNEANIRLHKFAMGESFFYISDKGIIFAGSDKVALSIYLAKI